MGKDARKDNEHLVNMLLDRQVKKERSSIVDVDLKDLKNKQRTVKMLKALQQWHAETDKLEEELKD